MRETISVNKPISSTLSTDDDPYFVTALARGLEVLSCYRSSDKLLGNGDLAERTGLPKSTISRLTHTLTRLEYLHFDPALCKYRLGSATLSLGSVMLSKLDVREVARPQMQELADFSRGMVSLGMRSQLSMIYVENRRSETALTLSLDVGSRIPIATTAMGRAYIAMAEITERDDILEQVRSRTSADWSIVKDGIDSGIEEYAKIGCCSSFGDWQKDVNAIAVSFHPPDGGPQLAISCGGPASYLSQEFLMHSVRPKLLELVRSLQRRLVGAHR